VNASVIVPRVADPAVLSVCVRGTDAAAPLENAGDAECIFLPVYDPEGGFVSGSGWIDSPPGGYTPDETLAGKAVFGFVSKYQPGATAPTGRTIFLFRMANFHFRSTEYEWLVVAGARAQFKGKGTVNGLFGSQDSNGYGFLLTATDGDLPGGGGTDKFRIKIVDKDDNGVVVYDNKLDASDDADPQEISRGSIVIHK
jgi:hypothetical protein